MWLTDLYNSLVVRFSPIEYIFTGIFYASRWKRAVGRCVRLRSESTGSQRYGRDPLMYTLLCFEPLLYVLILSGMIVG